ncbi:hypothetical protein T484DRAFT_1852464 [Baffinella frigidus]|nr:hypothetical protein T484DRAFT_1852464 [Cryptophyta sp. CCMP2293]
MARLWAVLALALAGALPAAPDLVPRGGDVHRGAVACFASLGVAAGGGLRRWTRPAACGRWRGAGVGGGGARKNALGLGMSFGGMGDMDDGMSDEMILQRVKMFAAAAAMATSDETPYTGVCAYSSLKG